jgi:tetratricopeptide (TPR) repeat protein
MVIVNHRQARHGDARAEPDSHPSSAGTRGYLASMRTNVSARGQPISARGQSVSACEQSLFRHKELLGERDQESATPAEWRQVWMGFSRCFYEMGVYDMAINSGTAALEMNRHFPQAHKYIALALKASGDYDTAIATMTRAVLYEAPWDDKNLELNKALLTTWLVDKNVLFSQNLHQHTTRFSPQN